MVPRFLLDEQISPKVAARAVAAGVDVRSVSGSPLQGSDDRAVFLQAIREGRILVTYDSEDMSLLLGDLLKEGLAVPGLVLVDVRTLPPSDLRGLSSALVRLARRLASGEVQAGGGIFLQRGSR